MALGVRSILQPTARQLLRSCSQVCGRTIQVTNGWRNYSENTDEGSNGKSVEEDLVITYREDELEWMQPMEVANYSVTSTLVQKWVRHLEKRDQAGQAPVMCLICVEERLLMDEKTLNGLAWTSAYLMKHNLRNVIFIGFDKEQQHKSDKINSLPHILAERLHHHGTYSHVFHGANSPLSFDDSTTTISVAEELLGHLMLTETVPIFTNLLDASNNTTPVIADVTATAEVIAHAVKPFRMLFLDPNEGLLNKMGEKLKIVELFPKSQSPLSHAVNDHFQHDDKASDILKLLSMLSDLHAVSVVSPENIVQELHHPGKGTLIMKTSEKINEFKNLDDVDIDKLRRILEAGFGRTLKSNYFDILRERLHKLYISDKYSGAAIIVKENSMPMPYLDKITVHPDFQGRGISSAIWRRIQSEVPRLFWRSRGSNTHANRWYNCSSQGFWKLGDTYIVYWYGLQSTNEVPELLEIAKNWPGAFEENASTSKANRR